MMLDRVHPDLRWLMALMADLAAKFISAHEGCEITLKMKIPFRSQMIEEARAVDCYLQLREAKPEDRAAVLSQLADRYECDEAQIMQAARLGHELLNVPVEKHNEERR